MPVIVIADDSMFQRHILGRIAREAGFEIIEAKSGQECLDLALDRQPDVLLLDLNMPVRNGFEVLQALREARYAKPVVILSADIQETSRQRCRELGVSLYLNKPVDEPLLLAKLRELIG